MKRFGLLFLVLFCGFGSVYFVELAQAGYWGAWFGVAVCISFGLGLIYYLLAGFAVVSVIVRTLLTVVPVGALAAAIILIIMSLLTVDINLQRALIAATVVASGWVVTFVTGEWRALNQEQERRRDIIQAAIVEVELIADHGRLADWNASMTKIKDSFFADRRYQVFIYYGHQFVTLRRLVEQVEILQKHQIRPVMDLFQILDRLERMEARISDAAYATLPWERREAGVLRFLELQSKVPDLADNAVEALKNGPFFGVLPKSR